MTAHQGRGRDSRDADSLDGLGRSLEALIAAGLLAACLPGLVAGGLVALALRALRLRWTWAALLALALTRALRVTPTGGSRRRR